jgi:uncharacterized protein (DUF427 family)
MKATVGGTVVAEASNDELVKIEGNWYFPPATLKTEYFVTSPTPYTCPWKGAAQYFSVKIGDDEFTDAAWSYPEPYPTAFDRVGTDFANYVAFTPGVVTVSE